MFVNVGGNFGQILEQGQRHRDNMRLQADIANMRYNKPQGGQGNTNGGGGADDMHKYMKLGLEMAEVKAKLDQMGEQLKKQKMDETNSHFYKIAAMAHDGNYGGAATYFKSIMADSEIPGYPDQTYRQVFDEQTDGVFSKGAPASFGNTQYKEALTDKVVGIASSKGLFVDYTESTMPQENQTQQGVGYSNTFATMDGNEKYTPGKKWKAGGGNDDGLIPKIQSKIAEAKERKQNAKDNLSGGQNIQAEEGDEVTLTEPNNQQNGQQSQEATNLITTELIDKAIESGDLQSLPEEWRAIVEEVMSTTVVGTNNKGEPIIVNLSEPLSMLTAKFNQDLDRQKQQQQQLLGAMMSNPLGKQATIDMNTQDAHIRQQEITKNIQDMTKQTTEHMRDNFNSTNADSVFSTLGNINQASGNLDTNTGIQIGGKSTAVPKTNISISTGSNKESAKNYNNESAFRQAVLNEPSFKDTVNNHGGKLPETSDEWEQYLTEADLWDKLAPKEFDIDGVQREWRDVAKSNLSAETRNQIDSMLNSRVAHSVDILQGIKNSADFTKRGIAALLDIVGIPELAADASVARTIRNKITYSDFINLREKGFQPKDVQAAVLSATKASGNYEMILEAIIRNRKDSAASISQNFQDPNKLDKLAVAYYLKDYNSKTREYEGMLVAHKQGAKVVGKNKYGNLRVTKNNKNYVVYQGKLIEEVTE